MQLLIPQSAPWESMFMVRDLRTSHQGGWGREVRRGSGCPGAARALSTCLSALNQLLIMSSLCPIWANNAHSGPDLAVLIDSWQLWASVYQRLSPRASFGAGERVWNLSSSCCAQVSPDTGNMPGAPVPGTVIPLFCSVSFASETYV